VLLVHVKLYDYAVYCTVRICSITFLVDSDTILQWDGTSKQKYLLCVSERRVNDNDYQNETGSSMASVRFCNTINNMYV